ncbi:MAG TPA: hypothetical protein VL098_08320 [Flavipsychrobacter sp.]|nr:hypothetical protein [Flavipsychrobacter sp.]
MIKLKKKNDETDSFYFFMAVFVCQCSAHKNITVWTVKEVKTNYVQKGSDDKFELPFNLKGKKMQLLDSLIILSEVRRNYLGSTLSDEFTDTIFLKDRIFFKREKDDTNAQVYPGDEFTECIRSNNDTCFISNTFLNLLGFKGNGIEAYLSPFGKHTKTKCIFFVLKEDKEIVLYCENDFLLLFFVKESNE